MEVEEGIEVINGDGEKIKQRKNIKSYKMGRKILFFFFLVSYITYNSEG